MLEPLNADDALLRASVPRLQTLRLAGISFPAIPNLLLSATNLLNLDLFDLPNDISLYTMVATLAGLTNLKSLHIKCQPRFISGLPVHPFPQLHKATALPALSDLPLLCSGEFVEGFVTWINAPLVATVDIPHFDLISPLPLFSSFICRAEKLKSLKTAFVCCSHIGAVSPLGGPHHAGLRLSIPGYTPPQQRSSVASAYHQALRILSDVDCLEISENQLLYRIWPVDQDDIRWLDFFPPVSAEVTALMSSSGI
jgi:hypothetical protein